ncbi:S8 family serine peptidase, partial [candidate division WOR-3 bacterium]|nr:S8 family serine peptidase [candidate division WOR-3 bacterium]
MSIAVLFCVCLIQAPAFTTSPYITHTGTFTFTPEYYQEYDNISINGFYFDPLIQVPELAPDLIGESGYYILQIKGPVYNEMKQTLTAYGVQILEYTPFNAFIVRMRPENKVLVADIPFVRWIGNYEPAYKISGLFDEIPHDDRVVVLLFLDTDVDETVFALEQSGCTVLDVQASDHNRVVVVRATEEQCIRISKIPGIMYLEPYQETVVFNEHAQWVTQTWESGNRKIWNKGLDGTGQVVNTSDTGILTTHNMFRDPAYSITTWGNYPNHRKIIAYQYPTGTSAAFGDNAAGSWHGTHTAGTICGDDSYVSGTVLDDGMPLKAKMYFEDIGTSSGGLSLPSNYDYVWQPPYTGNAGGAARVSSNSWGQSVGNSYSSTSRMVDIFMWNHKDFIICFSAGNDGPTGGSVHPPGTAKDCITAGACGNASGANAMASFSSRGPTADNRLKPTVTAPGVSLRSSLGPNNDSYSLMSGTSMSSPCIGGNCALVRDYFASGFYPTGVEVPGNAWTYISAAMVKACLVNSALPDIQGSTIPDNNTGWGRICLDEALFFANDIRQLAVWDDTHGVATGEYDEYVVTVNNQSEPLKITVVWTDYYGAASSNPALVNNLDLRVTSPTANVYLGNVYSGGQSTTGGSADTRNVEENVRRNIPETGTWTIRVTGTAVPQGTRQPYALVVSGGLGNLADPILYISGSLIQDPSPGGNGNGRIEPGETVYLTDTLGNASVAGVTNCSGVLRTNSSYITLIDSTATFGSVPSGGSANNGSNRFNYSADGGTPPGTIVDFTLHLTGDGGYSQDIEFCQMIGISGLQVIWGPKQLEIEPGDTHFIYGLGYNTNNDRLYVANFYERKIYMYTSDSFATYLGYLTAPDTMGTDIKYCSYDNTLWFAGCNQKRVSKLNLSGTVLRYFTNPAQTYPIGIAWLEPQRTMFLSERLNNSTTSYIYRSDTMGTWDLQIQVPLAAYNATRCLASDPYGSSPYGGGDTTL